MIFIDFDKTTIIFQSRQTCFPFPLMVQTSERKQKQMCSL